MEDPVESIVIMDHFETTPIVSCTRTSTEYTTNYS